MSVRYENNKDREREVKAIEAFTSFFGGSHQKLGPWDIDFRYKGDDGKTKAYIEVKGRMKDMADAYPLPVAARKLIKLADKEINPILIWACFDGIIYGRLSEISGDTRWGGRKQREGAVNDQEVMCYYGRQSGLKFIPYK
tara:strand:- start:134 stop:553 length:420 start_codon:yes stop_codon:yes gene_type:complete